MLSEREQEVLNYLVKGLSNKEIADLIGISEKGTKWHVASILVKSECRSRTQLIAKFYDERITPEEVGMLNLLLK